MSTPPPQGPPAGGAVPPPGGQPGGQPGGPAGLPMPQGIRPTPEQLQEIQRRIAADAEKAGMSVPEFVEQLKKNAIEQRMRMMAQQQAQQQAQGGAPPGAHNHPHPHPHPQQGPPRPQGQGQPQPITPGPPNPKAIALAKFLKGQNLKPRTSILNGERKDMFRGKRTPTSEVARTLWNDIRAKMLTMYSQ